MGKLESTPAPVLSSLKYIGVNSFIHMLSGNDVNKIMQLKYEFQGIFLLQVLFA